MIIRNLLKTRNKMLNPTLTSAISIRGFKNFGHKRQPEATFTVLWHGFLTFTFIGMGIEWKKISTYFFGNDETRSTTLDNAATELRMDLIFCMAIVEDLETDIGYFLSRKIEFPQDFKKLIHTDEVAGIS